MNADTVLFLNAVAQINSEGRRAACEGRPEETPRKRAAGPRHDARACAPFNPPRVRASK